MEARTARRALTAALVGLHLVLTVGSSSLLGAGYRTANFVVSARNPGFAKQVGDQAEVFRRELAVQWLGHELPNWGQPCPIRVDVGANKGAGGATTFMFDQNRPFGWTMEIQGSEERILDSVLPHEITHTIFATHFGRPLPRWADEGACTTVECASEKANHERMLRLYLTSTPSRGIPFNRMVAMTEYPHDIMPLYAQGHSVVQYLLHHGGQQKFVQFLGEAMRNNSWDMAVASYYGYQDLSDLQVKWVEWVRQGSPSFTPDGTTPSETPPTLASSTTDPNSQIASLPNRAASSPVSLPAQMIVRGQAPKKQGLFGGSITGGESWYARQGKSATPTESPIQVTETTEDYDPHRGPAAAAVPVRSADQRPKPMRYSTPETANWHPAGTSVVRKLAPAETPTAKELEQVAPILYDGPIGGSSTIWR